MTNKQYLLKLATKKYIAENKELLADYQEICESILMFKAMWGINIGIIFKDCDEPQGRKLGDENKKS